MQRSFHSRSGITYVTVLLLLFVGSAVWLGYALVPAYSGDWKFRREVEGQMIKASERSDLQIREYLIKQAEILKIDIGTGSLDIVRGAGEITITYKYDRPVPLPKVESVHFEKKMSRPIEKIQHLFHK